MADYKNAEGYPDPTAFGAFCAIEKEEKALRAFRPIVYICSPYAGDIETNTAAARRYCRFAVEAGYIPIAPHLLFPQFLNDADPNAARIIDAAERGIRLISIAFPLVGSQIVIGHFFQAIGRPAMSIFLNLTRQLIILVPLLCVLPNLWGADGIWLSQTCADALSAAVGFIVLYLFLRHNHLSKSVFSSK